VKIKDSISLIIRKIASSILSFFIKKLYNIDFSYVDEKKKKKKSQPIKRWVLMLPGAGCSWAKESGGCSMCGFNYRLSQINRGKRPLSRRLLKIFRWGEILIEGKNPSNLTIYNGGSFLNDEEIPWDVQQEICKKVSESPYLESLFVESRPEFVTEKKIKSLNSLLGGKPLKVGMGLECVTDYYRDYYVHKGLSRYHFQKAVNILKQNKVTVLVYVFLKPIHLEERESINEAIRTVEYAFSTGADEIALESAFIQEGTVMKKLYTQGEFEPPWLWSIIEVITHVHHLGPVYIGGFEDEPPPIDIPHNCPKCSSRIMRIFQEYNKSLNVSLLKRRYCQCIPTWKKKLLS